MSESHPHLPQSDKPGATDPRIMAQIAELIGARTAQVVATAELLDAGSTVPFVARYRKEVTGGLDDIQLRTLEERLGYLRELEGRRAAILSSIAEQGKLTDELRAEIDGADTKARLEDLYLPYKPKRRTRAQIAREAGLQPLADALRADPGGVPEEVAAGYVDAEQGIIDTKAALDGARAIVVESLSEDAELVGGLREWLWSCAEVQAHVIAGKEEAGAKYSDYFDHAEPIARIPSHRLLALLRARNEGVLGLDLVPVGSAAEGAVDPRAAAVQAGHALAINRVAAHTGIRDQGRAGDRWLADTLRHAWLFKLHIGLGVDLMLRARESAEEEAIRVFGDNLKDLMMAAPAGAKPVMGLDPGLRTGVKVVVVDATGKLVATETIYPHAPRNQWDASIATLGQLAERHGVKLVAIGNGTASRETDRLAGDVIKRHPALAMQKLVVSEAGASVYSASELASKEFPDVDVSLRGAVSIARRLQDPLAELVKIEPKAIGVGQYQHDVNQSRLARALDARVEDCVNAVGVEVNTASAPLLARVAGLSPAVAENIVQYRDDNGPFRSRREFLKVARLGGKTFEQCAGFLRIANGDDPLDASAVHPEAYPLVLRLVKSHGRKLEGVIGDTTFLRSIEPERFTDERFGLPTVRDILAELEKPGRDPRPEFKTARFTDGVEDIKDLEPGMLLEGVVSNVAAFGAFVDLGVHQDGLVHISALSDRFVKDPREVVKAGDIVRVKVMEVDLPRKRIGLSMRLDDTPGESSAGRGQRPPRRPESKTNDSGGAARRDERKRGGSRGGAANTAGKAAVKPVPGNALADAFARARQKD